jgi:hypothetical protein
MAHVDITGCVICAGMLRHYLRWVTHGIIRAKECISSAACMLLLHKSHGWLCRVPVLSLVQSGSASSQEGISCRLLLLARVLLPLEHVLLLLECVLLLLLCPVHCLLQLCFLLCLFSSLRNQHEEVQAICNILAFKQTIHCKLLW